VHADPLRRQPGLRPAAGAGRPDRGAAPDHRGERPAVRRRGDTDELPSLGREAYQPDRYGEQWAPLLVTWADPASTDVGIGGGTKGIALTTAVPGEHGPHILSGQVVLDAAQRLSSGFGPGSTEGEVLLHELAHAVGLGHVDDPTQVMYYRTTNSESQFGAGDRAGLQALGTASGCLPAPRPAPLGRGA
jgi:hypothetical protein